MGGINRPYLLPNFAAVMGKNKTLVVSNCYSVLVFSAGIWFCCFMLKGRGNQGDFQEKQISVLVRDVRIAH